ncbi:hypothetical protein Taro_036057 [Colocasia esculenta]|uniref:SCP domain-containing protein n=1 Tax=Colocasia esculenta TaxID=4460 RepID=A0A843W8J6_COLES|nr:hypothetical protein [Colocasia esculenta]
MAAAFFTSPRLLVAVATLALCAASSAVAARSRHNEAREVVGVAPLKWSPRLAGEASRLMRYQRDKKGCEFADLSSSNYGANQAWSNYVAGPAEVVESWVEEKQYYNHSSNTCAANHTASPVTDDPEQMVEPAVKGSRYMVEAAAGGLRRVVLMSSIGAVHMDPNRPTDAVVDESCWSDLEFCKATKNWYCYGKAMAEREAWMVAREKGDHAVWVARRRGCTTP